MNEVVVGASSVADQGGPSRSWKVVSKPTSNHDREGGVMATATETAHGKELHVRNRSSTACHFEEALREKIVGQEEAV